MFKKIQRPRFNPKTSDKVLSTLPKKGGKSLVNWFVDSMKLFDVETDDDKKTIVLIFLSDVIQAVAQQKGAEDIIDYFFSPLGLEGMHILLPKYASRLDSLRLDLTTYHVREEIFFKELIELLNEYKQDGMLLKVLIAGGAGGGKSTIAKKILNMASKQRLKAKYSGMDAYTFDREKRKKRRLEGLNMYEGPKINEMIRYFQSLTRNPKVDMGIRFRKTNKITGKSYYEAKPTYASKLGLFLFEGILTLAHQKLRKPFDVGIYVHESDEKRFQRRLKRDQNLKNYSPIHIAWTFATTQRDEFRAIRKSASCAELLINLEKKRIYKRIPPS